MESSKVIRWKSTVEKYQKSTVKKVTKSTVKKLQKKYCPESYINVLSRKSHKSTIQKVKKVPKKYCKKSIKKALSKKLQKSREYCPENYNKQKFIFSSSDAP